MSGKISGDSRRAVLHRLERTGTLDGEQLYQGMVRGGVITLLNLDQWAQQQANIKQMVAVGNYPEIRTTTLIASRVRSMLEQLASKNMAPTTWQQQLRITIIDPATYQKPVVQRSTVRRRTGNQFDFPDLDAWAQKQEAFKQAVSVGNYPRVVTTKLVASRIRSKMEYWVSKNLVPSDWSSRLEIEEIDAEVSDYEHFGNQIIQDSGIPPEIWESAQPSKAQVIKDLGLGLSDEDIEKLSEQQISELLAAAEPERAYIRLSKGESALIEEALREGKLIQGPKFKSPVQVLQEIREGEDVVEVLRERKPNTGPAINAFEGYENAENTKPSDLRNSLFDPIRSQTPKVELTEWTPGSKESPVANDTISNDTQQDVSPAGPNLFE